MPLKERMQPGFAREREIQIMFNPEKGRLA